MSKSLVPIPTAHRFPIRIGKVAGFDEVLEFDHYQLFGDSHIGIYGGTGKGKSKLSEHLLRQVFAQHDAPGGIIIDPHGDLVDSLMLYIDQAPHRVHPRIVKNLHYVQLQGDQTFSLDPFDPIYYQGVSSYANWLVAQVERVALGIIRMQGEYSFKHMPQLERYLKALLTAAGTRLDDDGTHLPLSDIDILYRPEDPRFHGVLERIMPKLDRSTRYNLQSVYAARPGTGNDPIASTINRLDGFFSPQTRAIFSCERPTIDIPSIIENQGWLLVNLGVSRETPQGIADAVGSMLLRMVIDEVCSRTNIADRRSTVVWIDEASRYVGDDLIESLRESRKYKMSCCLCVQDLDALDTDEVKMSRKVTSLCDHQFTFQQKNEDDMARLAGVMAFPNLRFEKLYNLSNLTTGHQVVELLDRSEAYQQSLGLAQSTGVTDVDGVSLTEIETIRMLQAKTETNAESRADASMTGTASETSRSEAESEEHVSGFDRATGEERGRGRAENQGVTKSTSHETASQVSRSTGQDRSRSLTRSLGRDVTNESGETVKTGAKTGDTETEGSKIGEASANSQSQAQTIGEFVEATESQRTSSQSVKENTASTRKAGGQTESSKSSLNKASAGNDKSTTTRSGRKVEHTETVGTEEKRYSESSHSSSKTHERYTEESESRRHAITDRESRSDEEGTTDRTSLTDISSRSKARSRSETSSEQESEFSKSSESRIEKTGLNRRYGTSVAKKKSFSQSDTATKTRSRSTANEISEAQERGLQRARTQQQQTTRGTELVESEATTLAHITKQVLMAVQPIVRQSTGSLEDAVKDQLYRFYRMLRTIGRAQVLHNYDNRLTSLVNVDRVEDYLPSINDRDRQLRIDRIRGVILARHDYNFTPQLDVEHDDQRLERWLEKTVTALPRQRLADVRSATVVEVTPTVDTGESIKTVVDPSPLEDDEAFDI